MSRLELDTAVSVDIEEKAPMGEAKRRKEQLGDDYGKEDRFLPWLPITKAQSESFMKWSSTGAWLGIGIMIAFWVTVRFIGPGFGWWTLAE